MKKLLLLLAGAAPALAQLPPPPAPPGNPITEPKRVLGKLLFWEEQLSSDDTMACGTCHRPQFGGGDPRVALHPGPDTLFGTPDDRLASPGMVHADDADDYELDPLFGFEPQVTPRTAPTVVNAAYAPELFWDGRAGGTFVDPETGNISLPFGAALESQVVGPPVSSVEMAHTSRDWSEITAKLATVRPLALATDLPPDLAAVMANDPSYPDLFAAAFGSGAITAERIAFAIATYERTLIADQTPWDRFMAGDTSALTASQQIGWQVFQSQGARCGACHTPPFFTNQSFRNIGLRPVAEDLGRQEVTGNPGDRGRFRVPTLRNAALKPRLFHNGGVLSSPLENMVDVIEFYLGIDGHVHFPDNLDPIIPTIAIAPQDLPPLADFLTGGLVDPRVAAETFPFDRPTLASERRAEHLVVIPGTGNAGSGGVVPQVIAQSPPASGSNSFRLGIHSALPDAPAYLGLFTAPPTQTTPRRLFPVTIGPEGYATWHASIPPSASLVGVDLYAQWLVSDGGAVGRVARTDLVRLTVF